MMFVDDYGCVRTEPIIHVCPFELHHDPDCPLPDRNSFCIGLLLRVGKKAHRASLDYPTRQHRDAALERLLSMISAETVVSDEEEL